MAPVLGLLLPLILVFAQNSSQLVPYNTPRAAPMAARTSICIIATSPLGDVGDKGNFAAIPAIESKDYIQECEGKPYT